MNIIMSISRDALKKIPTTISANTDHKSLLKQRLSFGIFLLSIGFNGAPFQKYTHRI